MNHPTSRVLAILELLQKRACVSGAELARSIGVDRRTIRRYIVVLEDLGIPITTDRGPHGGYQLVAGYKIPPMMFTNDEALVLALGLVAAQGFGLATKAVSGAQAKLERVMPADLKGRMRSVTESVAFAQSRHAEPGDNASLPTLCSSAHHQQTVRMEYQTAVEGETLRDFDPYGLAFSGGRWYTVGFCHLRRGLRSFRLDRVKNIAPLDRHFERPPEFDALEHLVLSIATLPRKFSIEIRLETDLESAQRELFRAFGVLEPISDGVLLRSQADDLSWFARELARLPWPFEIRAPSELTAELRKARPGPFSEDSQPGAGTIKVAV
jgi:predicted DNA-binding transcriptional regulator YafY